MFQKFLLLGERVFPERQISVRSGTQTLHLRLPTAIQMAVVAGSLLCATAGGVTLIAESAAEASRQNLAATVESMKTQLAEAQQAVDAAEARLAQVSTSADGTDLSARVEQLEGDLKTATQQQSALKTEREKLAAEKAKLQTKLTEIEQDKDKSDHAVLSERDKLKQKVADLEARLRHAVGATAATPTVGQTPAPDDSDLSSAAPTSGFSLDKFLAQLGIGMKQGGSAVGGPYVALGAAKPGEVAPSADNQAVLKMLPLSAPLDTYQLESKFGARVDPFNGHRSMHTGLDMSAPYKSPVYSTSAGVVVFAGVASDYGKMVEIDHGNGLHTRYAHLNRLMVNVGQHIGKHAEVGLLGSTGRSTGPHVHYEVLVNGVAQDPEKFLSAGRSLALVKAAE